MRLIAFFAYLLVALPTGATEPPVRVIITGQKFVDEVQSGDKAKILHAAGYMHAVQDMISLQGAACLPDDLTSASLLTQLATHTAVQEDRARTPAAYFIGHYLFEKWPCPKGSKEEATLK